MKIPYTILPPDVFKPLVSVRIGNAKKHKVLPNQLNALIDSGADVCFCSIDIAAFLQIDLNPKNKKTFFAADNKSFEAIKYACDLYVNGKKYACPIYFSDTLPKSIPIILGQKGFFDHFKITFDLPKKEIEII